MALTATLRRFTVTLADSDRGVYETLDLRAAQHPSETDRYLVTRVLEAAREHAEGLDFTKGLSENDEPALWQRDLRGDLQAWIEVGSPSVERLHKASKTGARLVVYGWQRMPELAKEIASFGVHRAEELALHAVDPKLLDTIAATLDRVNKWDLAVSGGQLYLTIGGKLFEGEIARVPVVIA